MLKPTQLVKTASVERLLKLWAKRYEPDLSPLPLVADHPLSYEPLVNAASAEGRALTAAKLHERLIEIRCRMAELQTNALYGYIPNILDLAEAKRLPDYAFQIYAKLIEIYQQQSLNIELLPSVPSMAAVVLPHRTLAAWGMPAIDELATALEPVLLEFQEQHIISKDWRTLGFITTLLNFTNQLLPSKLTVPEQVLIKPYLKFIEEQVALPWQRVCTAAAAYEVGSPAFALVERMFPASHDIAKSAYQRLVQLLPEHRSRRGALNNPGINHSCIRDLEMFQAYLWLCFLEQSLAPVEEELVDLCVMVLPSVDVKWEMIELWNQVLADEVLSRVTPDERALLLPYTEGLQQAFFKKRDRFKFTSRYTPVFSHSDYFSRSSSSFFFPAEFRRPLAAASS